LTAGKVRLLVLALINALLFPASYFGIIVLRQLAYDRSRGFPPAIRFPSHVELPGPAGAKIYLFVVFAMVLLAAMNYLWLGTVAIRDARRFNTIAFLTSLCIVGLLGSYGYFIWRPFESPAIYYAP